MSYELKPMFRAVVRLCLDVMRHNFVSLGNFLEFWFLLPDKPRFPKGLINKEVDEDQELTLSIQCSAVPEPKIKW